MMKNRSGWLVAVGCLLVLSAVPPTVAPGGSAPPPIPIYYTYGISDKAKGPYVMNNNNPLLSAAFIEVKWSLTNKSEGVFDWTLIDKKIRDWTGSSSPSKNTAKKVFISIVPYDQDPLTLSECLDYGPSCRAGDNSATPSWVYDKGVSRITFICGGTCQGLTTVAVPKVWDPAFSAPYEAFLAALGNRYRDDLRVAGFLPGFGHLGTMNAQPATDGAAAFISVGWTLQQWRDYIKRVLDMSQRRLTGGRYFPKRLIVRTPGKFLENYYGQSFKLVDHLDVAEDILGYAAGGGVSVLFHALTPNQAQYAASGIPQLASYLAGLDIRSPLFAIGFDDDYPLWVPPDRQVCPSPTCGRDEAGLDAEFSYAFSTWNSIARKYPVFFAFLDPEASTTNTTNPPCPTGEPHEIHCFRQSVYDVVVKWLVNVPPRS